jgi:hypothetical protein
MNPAQQANPIVDEPTLFLVEQEGRRPATAAEAKPSPATGSREFPGGDGGWALGLSAATAPATTQVSPAAMCTASGRWKAVEADGSARRVALACGVERHLEHDQILDEARSLV